MLSLSWGLLPLPSAVTNTASLKVTVAVTVSLALRMLF